MSRDEGFVTVAIVGLALALATVASLVVALASVAVARHRAASAADLAALAGARHALEGPSAACEVARRVARAQAAEVERCALTGLDLRLVVSVRAGAWLDRFGTARAEAAAGPGTDRGLGPS